MKPKYLFLMLILFSSSTFLFSQPASPTGLTAGVENWMGMKYITLNWDGGSSKSIQYFVYKKEGSLTDTGSFMKLPFSTHHNFFKDKLVTPGQTYSYFVTAYEQEQESEPSDSVEITIGDSLAPAHISGTVTDESTGLPLTSGRVQLIPMRSMYYRPISIDSNGNYSAYALPGKYFIHFTSPWYVPEFYDNANSIFDATQIELTENSSITIDASLKPFVAPAQYTLSGKVTDAAGNPLKAIVSVGVLNRHWFRHALLNDRTDSLGNYSIRVREGDSVVVFAHSPYKDYLPEFYNDKHEFAEADRIYINGDITNIDFVLEERPDYNNSISGTITDQDGNPVMASVTLFGLREHRHPKFKRTIITDSLGNYSFSNIYPGYYLIHTLPEYGYLPTFYTYDGEQAFRWKDADSIEVTETSVLDNINIKVLPLPDSGFCLIRGSINDNYGSGISGAMVYVMNENSNMVSFGTTDQDGNYSINNLAQGNYTIITDKFDYEGSEQTNVSVDYSENQTQTVTLTMEPLSTTSVNETDVIITDYKLAQNYPNPFNPATVINYQIPQTGFVSLKIYNVIGQEVASLVNEVKNAGNYNITFSASGLNSGIYFYTLTSGNTTISKKMTLLK